MLVVLDLLLEYSALSATLSTCFVLWFVNFITRGRCTSKAKMCGKTVLITGASSGIGKATALDLAKRGARVILACRNIEKANTVRDEIIKVSNNKNVVVKKIDLSVLGSVRHFGEQLNREETRLDVLVHNAGGVTIPYTTEEGLNSAWASNHFGAFLLTHLLIDLLKKTKNSRIVIVSSALHWFGSVNLSNVNPVDEKAKWKVYCDTKFANVLFANELSRRIKYTGVTVNALHPGVISTPIWRWSSFWGWIVWMMSIFLKDEDEGAQTTIFLAVSEKVDGITGKYFEDCREWFSQMKTRDVQLARAYWTACEKIVQLKSTDPKIS